MIIFKKYLLVFIALFLCLILNAQKVTISGYVRDADTGENLIGATVYDLKEQKGAITNTYGFYSLTLSTDTVQLIYSYVGYQSQILRFHAPKDTLQNTKLKSAGLLDVVIVSTSRAEQLQESARMSTIVIPIEQIKRVPAMFGEVDVMKVLQLLPGVQSGNEGGSNLYVRGGGADQNLILLDGVPVYNASHLYGFFSTFNADAINHVELVKGGFPARYGGRLSSVVDISMKEGNQISLHGEGSFGIISSKFTLEGPLKKDKTSFIISGRRTYLNLLSAAILKDQTQGISDGYYFYDLNTKINHRINNRNRVYLSAYFGEDNARSREEENFTDSLKTFRYSSKNKSSLEWGNSIVAVRWNHVYSKKIFSNLSATYSRYRFGVGNRTSNTTTDLISGSVMEQYYTYQYNSGIEDYSARIDFDFIPSPSHCIRMGVHFINHHFTPGILALKSSDESFTRGSSTTPINADEFSGYIEDDWAITPHLRLNAGLHASAFLVGEKTYSSLQPRVSGRYLLNQDWSLKASYATMQQFIHLLTNAGIGLPTDLWVPSTGKVRPQFASQGAVGFARTFQNNYEISLEAYYKKMTNLIEYKDGATFLSSDQDWQSKIETGQGRSYGSELLVQKKMGSLSGWLGYTLSWTSRQFDNLNKGKWFPYRYDRRHDVKIVLSYFWNEKFDLGATWVYGTGNAMSIPLDMYYGINTIEFRNPDGSSIGGSYFEHIISHYESRNDFRMKAYHRLDLSLSYIRRKNRFEHRWNLSIYNTYSRKNPFYLEFGYDKSGNRILRQVSLFPVLPSITYSLQF